MIGRPVCLEVVDRYALFMADPVDRCDGGQSTDILDASMPFLRRLTGRPVCLEVVDRGDVESVSVVRATLSAFRELSGLAPSPAKSSVFFSGVQPAVRGAILEILGFAEGALPGVELKPVGARVAWDQECRRLLQVAYPRLIWSFDSAKNRDLRVRSVVERSMKEGLGSEEEDVQPYFPSFAVVEVNRLEGSTLVEVRDSIEVCPPDLGVAPSCEDELLPADGGQRSSEQALQEGVDLSGGSDLAIGVGLVATVASGGVSAMAGCAKLPQTEGLEDEGLPELQPLAGDDGEREKGLGATVASSDAPVVAGDGGTEDPGELQGWATSQTRVEDEGGEHFSADALCSPQAQVRSLSMVSLPVPDLEYSSSSAMATALPGRLCKVLDAATSVDRLFPGNSVSPFAATRVDCLCPLGDVIGCVEGSRVFVDDGGLVSEEVLVTPVASAALRPQPADGPRQPPLSPVELVVVDRSGPGVSSAVGLPGGGVDTPGVRSFATVVNPDRRANVELSFDPPADGGNVVVMTDTDGQEDECRACLIGYFLQGYTPPRVDRRTPREPQLTDRTSLNPNQTTAQHKTESQSPNLMGSPTSGPRGKSTHVGEHEPIIRATT
ncbi:hypothetical protein Dimus_013528 [Dionaea muscipula]